MRAATLHARRPAARGARAAAEAAPAPQAPPAAVTKLSLAGPPPQRFAVGKGQLLSIATAALGTVLRGGVGALAYGFSASLQRDDPAAAASYAVVAGVAGRRLAESSAVASFPRPAAPIVLYEFTACPFCRKVRDACSVLDLDVEFRPTPRDGARFRPKAAARSGKAQFPFMVDPNTGKEMLESDDIIEYLFDTYGPGKANIPRLLQRGALATLSASLAALPRLARGAKARASTAPRQPLELWAYEASPFCRVVSEVLTELELPHVYHYVARGSPRRQAVLDAYGHFQVPLLVDPNAGAAFFESGAIIAHLESTYGRASAAP